MEYKSTGMAQEVKLERVKYAFYKAWSEKEIEELANKPDVELALHANFMCDEIAMRVVGFVYKQELPETTISYPRDWWHAFKERWFPAWLLRRYPVVYKRHRYDASAIYPLVAMPDTRIVFKVSERDVEEFSEAVQKWANNSKP